ncbi:putative dienelactone hydrolase family protein [Eutypa lata UCREL1]|uniref:Putative dienelactone hydrolase family protein n=1 Tax=Eutypa lata (strain UCR-EL1) TaxID=1287681 RepID=M7TJL1_EUTLA|nr:putative dienelactone hydrolase family protein [Eutypa lata UCREL1]
MVKLGSLVALWSIASVGTATLQYRSYGNAVSNGSIIRHDGDPVGKEKVFDGINLYITGEKTSDIAVLYLTDVFGIQLLENKLLADSFGRAGFLTVAPDLFDGEPAPVDLNDPNFNTTKFLEDHSPEVTDPKIATAIDYLRNESGASKVAVTGYCFGGRYSFRFLAEGKGADVGFAAHPSLLEDAEITAIAGAVSVAAADGDTLMPPARRTEIEAALLDTGLEYSFSLYGGTQHGFGVRANVSDPKQKFGKEQAFFQAVTWFESWA